MHRATPSSFSGDTPPGVNITRLGDPDDPEVRAMLVDLELAEQDHYDHPRRSHAELAASAAPIDPRFIGENHVLVARADDGSAVGLCWCVLFDPGTGLEAEIAELYVRPTARGCGIATLLCAAALSLFRHRQVSFAQVWTRTDNPAALAAYRAAGFSPTEQTVLTWLPLPGGQDSTADEPDPPPARESDLPAADNVRP